MEKDVEVLTLEELRIQAEIKLAFQPASEVKSLADTKRLLHELQVHQIELEMQNNALRELVTANEALDDLVAVRTADLVSSRAALDAANSAAHAKNVFLATMSHELRTPLHAIMALTTLELRNAADEKQVRHLKSIEGASERLLSVINDILDFSKIDSGRMQLEHIEFTLAEVLRSVDNVLQAKAKEKGLQLLFQRSPRIAALPLLGDPFRIGQIIINLAGNAVKFTDSGSVNVSINIVEETDADILVRILVRDTGIGISEAEQQRIFSAFEQADSATTRRYGGSGLGLAISRQLACLTRGDIGVESQLGQGSTFWFTARLDKASG